MSLARLFLDLGRVEQGGDDGRRADSDREAGLHELRSALFAGVVTVAFVGHVRPLQSNPRGSSMSAAGTMEAAA